MTRAPKPWPILSAALLAFVTIKEYGFLTKAELDTEFAHWHDQMRG